uniref:Putative secreted protein n=1 Tax=Ixodes ricinus TaxID=34613 RepID=A0A6B0V752_IXORI
MRWFCAGTGRLTLLRVEFQMLGVLKGAVLPSKLGVRPFFDFGLGGLPVQDTRVEGGKDACPVVPPSREVHRGVDDLRVGGRQVGSRQPVLDGHLRFPVHGAALVAVHDGLTGLVPQQLYPVVKDLEARVGILPVGEDLAIHKAGEHLGLNEAGQEWQVGLRLLRQERGLVEVVHSVPGCQPLLHVLLVWLDDKVVVGAEHVQEPVEEDLPDRIVQPELFQLRVTVSAVKVCGGVVVRGLALNGMAIAGMAVRRTAVRGTTQEARPALIVLVGEGLPQVLQ